MSYGITWNLQLNVKEGKLEELKTLIQEMVDSTQSSEPGTTLYEWFLSTDGSKCHIREGYRDSEAALEHLGNFGAKFAERFLACMEPTSFSVYGSPSDQLREALAGFGAHHLEYESGFKK